MNTKSVIFIIEDSAIISELLVNVISRELNAHILTFDSCEAGLIAMERISPDLILLDYNLDSSNASNMNGKNFLNELNKREKNYPIIIISGQKSKAISVDLLQLGAVDYISKENEFFFDEIIEASQRMLVLTKLKNTHSKLTRIIPEYRKKGIMLTTFIMMSILLILIGRSVLS